MYQVLRFVDRVTDYILLLFFLLLFLIGGYTMYDTMLVYDSANGADLRSFRPIVTDDGEFVWDMSALSDDVVAWLTIPDTAIDYPVMQGSNNNKYLNTDPFGEYSVGGSIFLDFRNAADFSDDYSLIYGHHMDYGRMFGALDKYQDREYFDMHRTAELTVDGAQYSVTFFAVMTVDASAREIFAPTEMDAADILTYVQENAAIWTDPGQGRIVALSTCEFPQTTSRIVVLGVF